MTHTPLFAAIRQLLVVLLQELIGVGQKMLGILQVPNVPKRSETCPRILHGTSGKCPRDFLDIFGYVGTSLDRPGGKKYVFDMES